MYSAPAVSYPVGRFHIHDVLAVLCWLAAGLLAAAWLSSSGDLGLTRWIVPAVWLLSAAGVWRPNRGQADAQLRWDGQQWYWRGDGEEEPVLVRTRYDGRRLALLELRSLHRAHSPARWVGLASKSDPLRWRDFRRALWSSELASERIADAVSQKQA